MSTTKVYLLLIFSSVFFTAKCGVFFPADLPTIEALIALHKSIAKAEKEARTKITASEVIESENKSLVTKFHEKRDILDSKLTNIYSYVIFAASLGELAADVVRLTKDYKDFNENTYKYVLKKPFIMWYYKGVTEELIREVKYCKNSIVQLTLSGTDLLRLSMSDKMKLIYDLKGSITRARGAIARANLFCSVIVNGSWKPDYIWEILNAKETEKIAQKCIQGFKSHCK